jgi:hypothetical protein
MHQFLNAVFPQDPGIHGMWDGWGGHRHLSHLFRLEAAGFPLSDAQDEDAGDQSSDRLVSVLLLLLVFIKVQPGLGTVVLPQSRSRDPLTILDADSGDDDRRGNG